MDVEPEPDLRMARSRNWAFGAFILATTAMLLPWWVIRFKQPGGQVIETVANTPWHDAGPLTASWGPWVAGGLLVAALLLMFVRLAGRSFVHEPHLWRRDLLISAGLLLAAWLQTFLWPSGDKAIAGFWGATSFSVNGTAGFAVTTGPGLGWWCALAAAACLGVAFREARHSAGDTGTD